MISTIVNKIRFSVTSTTPVVGYPFSFKFLDVKDILVSTSDSNGNVVVIDSSNYSVTDPGDSGTLTFNSGYVFGDNVVTLTIYRQVSLTQLVDYRNGDVIDADLLEETIDRLTMMEQQISEQSTRALKIPITDQADVAVTLPPQEIRKNMLLGFDENGDIKVVLTSDIAEQIADVHAAKLAAEAAQASAETAQEASELAKTGSEAAQSGSEAAQAAAEAANTAAQSAKTAAQASQSATAASALASSSSASASAASAVAAATSESNAASSATLATGAAASAVNQMDINGKVYQHWKTVSGRRVRFNYQEVI